VFEQFLQVAGVPERGRLFRCALDELAERDRINLVGGAARGGTVMLDGFLEACLDLRRQTLRASFAGLRVGNLPVEDPLMLGEHARGRAARQTGDRGAEVGFAGGASLWEVVVGGPADEPGDALLVGQ